MKPRQRTYLSTVPIPVAVLLEDKERTNFGYSLPSYIIKKRVFYYESGNEINPDKITT
jgi:hypothetical protein